MQICWRCGESLKPAFISHCAYMHDWGYLSTLRTFCFLLTNNKYYKCSEENHLDATECFVALIICSICFGHLYAHHQEFETILVLLPHMVCDALVVGGRLLGAEQQAMRPGWGELCDRPATGKSHNFPYPGRIACCSAPNSRPPTTKASSWFSSLRFYNDARTNLHQKQKLYVL